MVVPRLLLPALALALASCSSSSGDPHSVREPDPLGNGNRIREIVDPTQPDHAGFIGTKGVHVTGAVALWNDTFDETGDGKSNTTLYVQDIGSQKPPRPYSGVGIYSPSFIPADLRVIPGDVFELRGPYQELGNIGRADFMGKVLPQLSTPQSTFSYEYVVPEPAEISADDLNDYAKGRQWLGMLVTIKDVTLQGGQVDSSGKRVYYQATKQPMSGGGATISNELFDLKQDAFPAQTTLKSVTGIVTWFFSFHIAPRFKEDLVQ